jgi:diguanylate cyclase (GGDEF)-like protein
MNSLPDMATAVLLAGFAFAPQPVLLVAPDGRVRGTNRRAANLFALDEGDSILDIAAGGRRAIANTLGKAATGSVPLPVALNCAGRRMLFTAWRVAGPLSPAVPLLVLQGDESGRMLHNLAAVDLQTDPTEGADPTWPRQKQQDMAAEAARLRRLSETDHLTGLLNARGLAARMRRDLAAPTAAGVVLYADLNGFKALNDRYGHAAGDAVLRAVGAALRDVVGGAGVAGRPGGDEFVLWCPGQDTDGLARLRSQTERAVAAPVSWQPPAGGARVALRATASVGGAAAPEDGATLDELLAVADARMYRCKSQRRAG